MKKILDITQKLGIPDDYIIPYGWYKGKIDLKYLDQLKDKPDGKYVLITSALNANAAGEGKTSTEIALNQSLNYLGIKSIACLREPSLGVSMNGKGGASGALNAQVLPDDINYHFNGDIHVLTSTINLIAAQIDNIIYQGNEIGIDPNNIVWNRAIDICDRSLRSITTAQDDKKSTPHHCEYVITVAHELSTIMTLAKNEDDFIERVNRAIVAYTFDKKPITVADLHMENAIRLLMHEALCPNIVQCTSGAPAIIHATPFANCSVGTSSVIGAKLALKLGDIVLQESGFGSECGGEKNLNLYCKSAEINPSAIVAVCSARSLKLHGGQNKDELNTENVAAVEAGLVNLKAHLRHLKKYNLPLVIAINRFTFDTDAEIKAITNFLDAEGIKYAVSEGPIKGETGSVDLAKVLIQELNTSSTNSFNTIYNWDESITEKINKICTEVYGATGVEYSDLAKAQIEDYTKRGYDKLPICMCKTPASITDDPKVLGAPAEFIIHIREIRLFAGAGFLVPLSGSLLMLPGHVKNPRCVNS